VKFSHVFITRPRQEAEELAGMLAPLGLQTIVQPAFEYLQLDLRASDPAGYARLAAARPGDLVVFTSPRGVEHGLAQIPHALLQRLRVAAIGPATGAALGAVDIPVAVSAGAGYTSEVLLAILSATRGATPGAVSSAEPPGRAFVVAAPGGRETLLEGLAAAGWQAGILMVYRAEPAPLDRAALTRLEAASGVLSVWTSGNALHSLSQRLPPAAWLKLCQGEWLVISERLRRLARAWGPGRIHLADGPGNSALLVAVRGLL
jgi:uroporphyrinogen-III synthase